MNDRLVAVMEYYEYTPSLFADEIGVIRSTISHIINGRNKPGVDILQKVLSRFPELSAEWLLTGNGKMFKPGNLEEKVSNSELTNVNDIKGFAQLTLDDFAKPGAKLESKTVAEEKPLDNEIHSQEPSPSVKEQEIEKVPDADKVTEPAKESAAINIKTERGILPIKRITVYYGDNTYTDFYAEQE